MPKVEQFPYEITEAEEKRIADTPKQLGNDDKPLHSIMFQQVEVTIEKVFDGGFQFQEDPYVMDNGYKIIWNMKSEWDDKANKPKTYKAKDGQGGTPSDARTWDVGDRVKVAMSRRDYWHVNNQESTPKGVIAWGVKVGSSANSSDAPAAPVARSYDQNRPAALGMTANMLSAMSNAGNTEKIGVTSESAWAILKDVMICNLEGRPLDEALSTLHSLLVPAAEEESPMVQAAVEAGGVITEVTENEEVQTVKW
jgi:ribosomal protein L12E/L44/L45/RPP1/RPP2